jgi:hypothetical protein
MRSALAYIYKTHSSQNSEKNKLYINRLGRIAFEYYVNYHEKLSKIYHNFFDDAFDIFIYERRDNEYVYNKTKEILLNSDTKTYFLLCHYKSYEFDAFKEALDGYSFHSKMEFGKAGIYFAINKEQTEKDIKIVIPNEIIEAEQGVILSDIDNTLLSDLADTSGKYVVNNTIYFILKVDEKGLYKIKARTVAKDGQSDSWYIAIGNEKKVVWHIPNSTKWKWNEAPFEWNLDKGEYILKMEYREYTPIDQIMVERH